MASVKTPSSSYPFSLPQRSLLESCSTPPVFWTVYILLLFVFFVSLYLSGLGVYLLYPARLAIRVPFAFCHIFTYFVLSTRVVFSFILSPFF